MHVGNQKLFGYFACLDTNMSGEETPPGTPTLSPEEQSARKALRQRSLLSSAEKSIKARQRLVFGDDNISGGDSSHDDAASTSSAEAMAAADLHRFAEDDFATTATPSASRAVKGGMPSSNSTATSSNTSLTSSSLASSLRSLASGGNGTTSGYMASSAGVVVGGGGGYGGVNTSKGSGTRSTTSSNQVPPRAPSMDHRPRSTRSGSRTPRTPREILASLPSNNVVNASSSHGQGGVGGNGTSQPSSMPSGSGLNNGTNSATSSPAPSRRRPLSASSSRSLTLASAGVRRNGPVSPPSNNGPLSRMLPDGTLTSARRTDAGDLRGGVVEGEELMNHLEAEAAHLDAALSESVAPPRGRRASGKVEDMISTGSLGGASAVAQKKTSARRTGGDSDAPLGSQGNSSPLSTASTNRQQPSTTQTGSSSSPGTSREDDVSATAPRSSAALPGIPEVAENASPAKKSVYDTRLKLLAAAMKLKTKEAKLAEWAQALRVREAKVAALEEQTVTLVERENVMLVNRESRLREAAEELVELEEILVTQKEEMAPLSPLSAPTSPIVSPHQAAEQTSLQDQVDSLEATVATLTQSRSQERQEKEALQARVAALETSLASVTKQRDEAYAKLNKPKLESETQTDAARRRWCGPGRG